jgi:hypothetical protein
MSKMKIKNELLNYMISNYENSTDIKTFCDNMLIEVQKEYIKNPKVYMSMNKDIRNENRRYLTAKTAFPISINKVKEFRVYVGTIDEYPNGTKDVRGKIVGKRKLIERLSTIIK